MASATHLMQVWANSGRMSRSSSKGKVSLTSSMHLRASGQSRSTTACPHRASTQDCSSGHSRSKGTALKPQVQFQVSCLGPSWALLHSGVRPSSCSQTPRRVSSSSDIVHASQSLTLACLSSHTGHNKHTQVSDLGYHHESPDVGS